MSSIQQQQQQPGAQRTVGLPNKDDTIIVDGQRPGDSVSVQSQLATANVQDGNITSKSNIGQVGNDLSNAHGASNAWHDGESAKVTEWGKGEIARILNKTKLMEEQLVAGAREQQKALDAKHQGELAKLVQQMDLKKAAELKELEDGLQRQIQAALTKSKSTINAIESDMNNRKMDLLKQAQLRQAKQIDSLSNLVVETKLVPTQTKTIIETNTNTAPVVAVATGGNISTGSAAAENYSSARLAAVPNAGQLNQAAEVTTGDMIANQSGRKVGEGAIVNTQTNVSQQQQPGAQQGQQQNITVQARPMQTERVAEKPVVAAGPSGIQQGGVQQGGIQQGGIQQGGIQQGGVQQGVQQGGIPQQQRGVIAGQQQGVVGQPQGLLPKEQAYALADRERLSGATQSVGAPAPIDGGRVAGTTAGAVVTDRPAAASTIPSSKREVDSTTKSDVLHGTGKHDDAIGRTSGTTVAPGTTVDADGKHHHVGLMGKVKHALGMEPKSTDATSSSATRM